MPNGLGRFIRGEHLTPPTVTASEAPSPETRDDPPERLTPRFETIRTQVFPYRGTETHGVAPTGRWEDVPPVDTVDYEFESVDDGMVPIPVRVTNEHGPDVQRRVRMFREYASDQSRMVVPMHDARTRVKIANLDAAKTVFVGDEASSANTVNGYPITPSTPFESNAENELYVTSGDGSLVQLAIMVEYTVNV